MAATPLATIAAYTGPALIAGTTELSYPELADRTRARAADLAARGVRPGDRVAFCGLNRAEIFELYLACAEFGAILLPLNNRLAPAELAAQLEFAAPALVYVADGFGTKFAGRSVIDLDSWSPATAPGGSDPQDPDSPAGEARGSWLDRDLLMVFTSGTTGRPKAAVLTGRSIHFTVKNGLTTQGLTASSRVLSALPTFHVGGLNIQVLPALLAGASVHLHAGFDPAAVLADLVEHRITHVVLVPAMLDAVAAQPGFDPETFTDLQVVHTGSSTIPNASVQPWIRAGIPVAPVYGATETGPTATVLPAAAGLEFPTLAGLPAPHTELRIVDRESGHDVESGETGEIWLRGPNLFDRYWDDPDATVGVFTDGWYRTRDAGRIHPSGYLEVVDRLDDVIISGGENVAAVEVEAALAEHPAIAEVAVVGRRHARWGHSPVAYIVASGPPPTIAELRDWCRGRLADFKRPTEVVAVDELPRTALGKVRKHLLAHRVD